MTFAFSFDPLVLQPWSHMSFILGLWAIVVLASGAHKQLSQCRKLCWRSPASQSPHGFLTPWQCCAPPGVRSPQPCL